MTGFTSNNESMKLGTAPRENHMLTKSAVANSKANATKNIPNQSQINHSILDLLFQIHD